MAYKNRRQLLIQTIETIQLSSYKDFELVIVDDASDDEHRLEDLAETYSFINLTRIEPEDKKWYNPSIPYNMAFRKSSGDKIIIQNPECAHIGDILSYVDSYISDGAYVSFSCLSMPEVLTYKYCYEGNLGDSIFEIQSIASGVNQMSRYDGDLGWYNHSYYAPRGLHFCSAIMRKDLNTIGGFDERFSQGYNYDDNELIWRISQTPNMRIYFADSPFVTHLYHYTECSIEADKFKQALCDQNAVVFNSIVNGLVPKWSEIKHEDF
jgi:glycosyltransferase involved in cell wall biosynthesis